LAALTNTTMRLCHSFGSVHPATARGTLRRDRSEEQSDEESLAIVAGLLAKVEILRSLRSLRMTYADEISL